MSTSVTSQITDVVVFKDMALVTRSGAFGFTEAPEAGLENEYSFVIPELPLLLDDSSLRLKLLDARGAVLRDVKLELAKKADKERALPGKDELEKLEREYQELNAEKEDRLSMIEEIKLWINRPMPGPPKKDGREQEPPRFPVAGYGKYLEEFTERLVVAERELRELEGSMLTLEREITVKSRLVQEGRRSSEQASERRWVKQALVRLHALPERLLNGGLEFQISYGIRGARWAPGYLLHQKPGQIQASIDMNVRVAQFTGEDWRGVRLRLSGASLTRLIQLPELPAQKLGRKQPLPAPALRPAPVAVDELFAEYGVWAQSNAAPVLVSGRDKYPDLFERLDQVAELGGVREEVKKGKRRRAVLDEEGAGPFPGGGGRPVAVGAPMPPPAPTPSPQMLMRSAPSGFADMPEEMLADEFEEEPDLSHEEHTALYAGGFDALAESPAQEKEMSKKGFGGGGRKRAKQKSAVLMAQMETETEFIDLDDELQSGSAVRDFRRYYMRGPEDVGRGTLALESENQSEAGQDMHWSLLNLEQIQDPGAPVDSHIPFVYECAGAVDVASDGYVHSAGIGAAAGEAQIEYRSAPAVNPEVFRRLIMNNPFDHPLPPGRVAVYVDGAFAFHTRLNLPSAPGARLQIPLGREEGLRVSRNSRFKESSSGVFAGNTDLDYEIETEVRSQLSFPVKVELIERLPLKDKGDKEIEIRKVKSEPEAESLEKYEGRHYKGGLKFFLELGAGEKAGASLFYRVTVPAKKELKGGNRR